MVRAGITTPGTTTSTYNVADQLTKTVAGTTTTNFTYDTDGNQLNAGARTDTYDLANRLTSTKTGTTTTSYTYDGSGNRYTRATNAVIDNRYTWDTQNPLPEVVLERTSANALTRRYINGPGGDPLSLTTSAGTFYYHTDPIGSVTDVTSSTGAAQWAYAYEPWGEPLTTTKVVTTAPTTPVGFTGEYLDAESGNYNLRAREYNPTTGRFGGLDPIDGARTDPYATSYGYVEGRPGVLIDPSGQSGSVGTIFIPCFWLCNDENGDLTTPIPELRLAGDLTGIRTLYLGLKSGDAVDAAFSVAMTIPIPLGKLAQIGKRVADAVRASKLAAPSAQSLGKGVQVAIGPGVEKAWNVLKRVREKGSPLQGYKGGRQFKDDFNKLPAKDANGDPITYREWDVNPSTKGQRRGLERVVTGSDGSAYYTADHYDSFLRIG